MTIGKNAQSDVNQAMEPIDAALPRWNRKEAEANFATQSEAEPV